MTKEVWVLVAEEVGPQVFADKRTMEQWLDVNYGKAKFGPLTLRESALGAMLCVLRIDERVWAWAYKRSLQESV